MDVVRWLFGSHDMMLQPELQMDGLGDDRCPTSMTKIDGVVYPQLIGPSAIDYPNRSGLNSQQVLAKDIQRERHSIAFNRQK